MLPAKAQIVKCPYCGKEKELMRLASGNTFGATYWSDNKCIAPMMPQVSPIQKCPQCGKYYFFHVLDKKEGDDYSFEKGELSYQEWKEAYRQFEQEKFNEFFLNDVRLWLIQSYNDHYYRNENIESPSQEEFNFISDIILNYIRGVNWSEFENCLGKAELYRLANNMEKCADILSEIDMEDLDIFNRKVYHDIKKRMEAGDCKVFKIR